MFKYLHWGILYGSRDQRMGYNWEAVGAYYAGFSASPEQAAKRKWYAQRVKATYEDIKKPHEGAK